MAKLNGPLSFTGTLGGIVGFERKDLEGTFARSQTALTKERIFSDPAFSNSLKAAHEGGGRSRAAKGLRRVLHPLDPVRVGCWQAQLTKALLPLQQRDTESVYGQRRVLFSRHGSVIEGFCLSRRTSFEGLVRNPLSFSLSKERLLAEVSFPALRQGANFFAPPQQSYFRLTALLGVVPDMVSTPEKYEPIGDYSTLMQDTAYSDWYSVQGGAPATTLQLQLWHTPPNDAFGLVLAVAVLFGAVNQWESIEPVTYQGSGRILALR